MKAEIQSRSNQCFVVPLGLALLCLLGISSAKAQTEPATKVKVRKHAWRLLTVAEGRLIVNTAWAIEQPGPHMQDCSHLTHPVYKNAGFEYAYDSSFELYAGSENFVRVRFPHPGDLIVWPGHVGIVVDPLVHSFYSLVSTGLEELDYEAPYWSSRGQPRFYRYKVQPRSVLSGAQAAADSSQVKSVKRRDGTDLAPGDRSPAETEEDPSSSHTAKAATRRATAVYVPAGPAQSIVTVTAHQIPSSIVVVSGSKTPSREEVAESISELGNAAGHVLRTNDLSKAKLPVVIVERFKVDRVEIKRDHGWAHLEIDSRVSISDGATQLKPLREEVLWELRRSASGWEALAPPDRTYVSHDAAVRNLAAHLAQLSESDEAAEHQEPILQRESQLANLLEELLSN